MHSNITTKDQVSLADIAANRPDGPSGTFYAGPVKRALDIVLVIVSAIAVAPIIAILAILIRRDGGPAFFVQDRVGRNGKVFKIWKLRSMVVDADTQLAAHLEADPDARAEWDRGQKLLNDPRVTPIGRLIRKTSVDELPQLWNVLIGDMSLVGPRPMLPEQQDLYPGTAYYRLRPGVTGLWQISSRNRASFAARAVFDNRYEQKISLGTDIVVLFRTLGVVARGTGC